MSANQIASGTEEAAVNEFGYRQELKRVLCLFAVFSVAFSIISITTGIFLNFGFAITHLGPASIWLCPRFVEMEYGVPAEAVRAAIDGIRRMIDSHHLRVSFPVEVRFTAADDIPLSTASGRYSAYLAVHMYKGQPYEKYFRAVEAVMRDLDGRPHWGKVHYQDADSLGARYPRFHEFLAVRDTVDPRGRFANAYLDRVGSKT